MSTRQHMAGARFKDREPPKLISGSVSPWVGAPGLSHVISLQTDPDADSRLSRPAKTGPAHRLRHQKHPPGEPEEQPDYAVHADETDSSPITASRKSVCARQLVRLDLRPAPGRRSRRAQRDQRMRSW